MEITDEAKDGSKELRVAAIDLRAWLRTVESVTVHSVLASIHAPLYPWPPTNWPVTKAIEAIERFLENFDDSHHKAD